MHNARFNNTEKRFKKHIFPPLHGKHNHYSFCNSKPLRSEALDEEKIGEGAVDNCKISKRNERKFMQSEPFYLNPARCSFFSSCRLEEYMTRAGTPRTVSILCLHCDVGGGRKFFPLLDSEGGKHQDQCLCWLLLSRPADLLSSTQLDFAERNFSEKNMRTELAQAEK